MSRWGKTRLTRYCRYVSSCVMRFIHGRPNSSHAGAPLLPPLPHPPAGPPFPICTYRGCFESSTESPKEESGANRSTRPTRHCRYVSFCVARFVPFGPNSCHAVAPFSPPLVHLPADPPFPISRSRGCLNWFKRFPSVH